ncbi:MAG TPA: metalloregulator ArsR/SmtB family transcription factor [Terracidiphilus sp.]|nr:metalloregulator ArsR/SmtB family transcription factor [Terracidiphilus sp.]
MARARRTALLKALADPKRFELLERIARSSCPLGCTEALSALAIAPATLSHHIKELENAGLIRVERAGKFHFLHLQPEVLEALADLLAALARPNRAQDRGRAKKIHRHPESKSLSS